jgi:hypothetical protein
MTPKEKAIDLIDKYHLKVKVLYTQDSIPAVMNGAMTVNSSKQCALIAVDEILDVDCCDMSEAYFYNHIEYWQEVKQEIENL